jgi:HNH endonuclease
MRKRIPAPERFWPKVHKTETCWLWTASLDMTGYGQFVADTSGPVMRPIKAHRFAYEDLVGPIPEGFEVDHLCKVKACVNPAHLEAVTPYVNNMRSDSAAAVNARKTRCIRGHELNGRVGERWRRCRTCANADNKRYRARKSAESGRPQ